MATRPLLPVLAVAALSLAAHLAGCSGGVLVSADHSSATGTGGATGTAASSGAGAGGSGAGDAGSGGAGSGGAGGAGGAGGGAGAGVPCPEVWGHVLGGLNDQLGRDLAVDSQGGFVMSLQHAGGVALDGVPLPSGPGDGYMLARLDASGAYAWSRTFGGSAQNEYLPVAVDAHDDVFLAGSFHAKIDLGEGVIATAPGHAAFVARFDAAGHPLWARGFPDAYTGATVRSLAVDLDGNVFLAGVLDPGESLELGTLTVTADMFLVKLAPDGHPVWGKGWNGAQPEGKTLVTTPAGHVILAGSLASTTDFGGGPLTTAGDFDVFLVELDAHGEHVWSRRYGDANLQRAWSLARAPAGDLLLSGLFFDTFDLGAGSLTTPAGAGFLARLDPTGAVLWSRSMPGADENVLLLAAPASGGVTLAGTAYGPYDVGCGETTIDASLSRTFVAHLDAGGGCAWQRDLGPVEVQIAAGLAVDAAGRAALGGYFTGSVDFGQGPHTADDADAFVTVVSGPCPP
jgi:hypothetical protein